MPTIGLAHFRLIVGGKRFTNQRAVVGLALLMVGWLLAQAGACAP